MSESGFEVQRKATRKLARVRVLYFSKGQPRAVDAECQNISSDGLFIQTRRRGPEEGTAVSLILHFDEDEELMLDGVVRWQGEMASLENKGATSVGVGIQFTNMEDAVRDALNAKLTILPDA